MNYLNQYIFSRLSVSSSKDKVEDRPLFLTSSVFDEKAYGRCLSGFKTRLGLDDGVNNLAQGNLRFLVNVTMSPWPTTSDFLSTLVGDFRKVAEEGVKRCILRNASSPDSHNFVIQGFNEKIHLVHVPMYNMANHRIQIIMTADLPADVLAFWKQLRHDNPQQTYTIANMDDNKAYLEDMIKPDGGGLRYRIAKSETPWAVIHGGFELSNVRVLVKESMAYADLDRTYPDKMPFYIYGNSKEIHLDHVLKSAPNAMISADRMRTNMTDQLSDEQLRKGLVVVLEDVYERSLQPL